MGRDRQSGKRKNQRSRIQQWYTIKNLEMKKKILGIVIKALIAILTAILAYLGITGCTMSMTISKNNQGQTSTKIESTNRADSTSINLYNK
jgi:hypothetical protein